MKRTMRWLSASAAVAMLCGQTLVLADEPVTAAQDTQITVANDGSQTAVLGTEYLLTVYVSTAADGTVRLSHQPPATSTATGVAEQKKSAPTNDVHPQE